MKNESISCDCWRNPPFLFTKVNSPNSDHNALATLQPLGLTLLDIFGVITYFNILEAYPIQLLYDISSASSISPNTINATLVDFFVCSLEMLTTPLTYISLPTSSALLSQRPPRVEAGLQHFPTDGYTLFKNCHSSASSNSGLI